MFSAWTMIAPVTCSSTSSIHRGDQGHQRSMTVYICCMGYDIYLLLDEFDRARVPGKVRREVVLHSRVHSGWRSEGERGGVVGRSRERGAVGGQRTGGEESQRMGSDKVKERAARRSRKGSGSSLEGSERQWKVRDRQREGRGKAVEGREKGGEKRQRGKDFARKSPPRPPKRRLEGHSRTLTTGKTTIYTIRHSDDVSYISCRTYRIVYDSFM